MYFQNYKIIKRLDNGGSSVSKYLLYKDNYYLLRLYDIRFMNKRYDAFKYSNFLKTKGIKVPKIYEYGEYKDRGYAILEWIEGKSLDNILDKSNEEIYGQLVGQELLKLHNVSNVEFDVYSKYINSIWRKFSRFQDLGIEIEEKELIESYINEHSSLLKNREACIIHGDFHPGNIILNEHINFIDMDVCKIGDPYLDLTSNAGNDEYYKFHQAVVNSYFNNDVPTNFHKIYNLYGLLYNLDYVFYTYRMENMSVEKGKSKLKEFVKTI